MSFCNTAPCKRLQRVLCRPSSYTAHAAKQRTGLYSGFSCNLYRSTAADTRQTQAAIIPPAARWSASQRRSTSSTYQIPPPHRTLYSSAQPPYYNNVYKGAGVRPVMDPCQTVQHTADHTSPAGSAPAVCGSLTSAAPGAPADGSASPPVQGQSGALHPAGQSSGRGRAGGAEPLTAAAASLFGLSPDSQ